MNYHDGLAKLSLCEMYSIRQIGQGERNREGWTFHKEIIFELDKLTNLILTCIPAPLRYAIQCIPYCRGVDIIYLFTGYEDDSKFIVPRDRNYFTRWSMIMPSSNLSIQDTSNCLNILLIDKRICLNCINKHLENGILQKKQLC